MSSWTRTLGAGLLGVMAAAAAGCQSRTSGQTAPAAQPSPPPPTTGNASGPLSPYAAIPASDLKDILSDLDKAHHEKLRLSKWAGTPFLPVEAAFKPFFANMKKENEALDDELKDWAQKHHVDLTYHYSNDVDGKAQKMMEDRQEKVIRGDKEQDFERDILMQMSDDYDWHLCRIRALLPNVRDTGLKDYLQKCEKMFEDGSNQIRQLLRRYQFK